MTKGDPRSIALVWNKDIGNIRERTPVPAPTCQRKRGAVVGQWLRVRQVNEMVLAKARVQSDIHVTVNRASHTRLARKIGGWPAGNRLGIEDSIADDTQTTGTFCNQDAAVRKKCETVGILEFLRNDDNPDILPFGRCEIDWLLWQRRDRKAPRQDRAPILKRNRLLGIR